RARALGEGGGADGGRLSGPGVIPSLGLGTGARRAGVMLGLLLGACLPETVPGISGRVDLAPPGADAIRLVYLGSGGWLIEHRGEQILTAPLFSNPDIVRTGLAGIEADTAAIDRHMGRYDVTDARAILVGHAHYDHLMDVPRVASIHAVRARILGSPTTANTLGFWSGLADRIDVVDEAATADQETVGRWIRYGDRVRVMPLRSRHGPHLYGITLYRGSIDTPLREPPRRAPGWVDGRTLAFLVDFLEDDGEIAFRIYYQDATAPPPLGFAPDALVAAHPVDVAILVPATFEEVDWHP